jgi:hypothetical protein
MVDYMADVIADKVSQKLTNDKPQNGFESVNEASRMMVNLGGSKFKKTRRFKLTNKNKTKKL